MDKNAKNMINSGKKVIESLQKDLNKLLSPEVMATLTDEQKKLIRTAQKPFNLSKNKQTTKDDAFARKNELLNILQNANGY